MKTIAFVIGNSEYFDGDKLPNARNDAIGIKDVFEKLGYTVHYYHDVKGEDCPKILEDLANSIGNFDATIFYYSGHGFEQDGENYLPAVTCQIQHVKSKYDLIRDSISLSELMKIFSSNTNKSNIVILDACRSRFNNRGINTEDVFAPFSAPQGTLIAFSTTSSKGASDGKEAEGNSPYTRALLQYLGIENLQAEDLFKRVRRTVYEWTKGKQIPWEHTSLIGDFYFNRGQMVYKLEVPYSEAAVKDSGYTDESPIGILLYKLRVSDWNVQNPAMSQLVLIPPTQMDKNQQFIFGRNICQAGSIVHNVVAFVSNLSQNLLRYNNGGVNHVLNGILFEIYFDSHGEFRNGRFKTNIKEQVFSLRKDIRYKSSFQFIQEALKPYQDRLAFIPSEDDEIIDINIDVRPITETRAIYGEQKTYNIIDSIRCGETELIRKLSRLDLHRKEDLIEAISDIICCPKRCIVLHPIIELQEGFEIPYDMYGE